MMQECLLRVQRRQSFCPLLAATVVCCLWLALAVVSARGEAAPPITPSGLNTQISGPIAVGGESQFNITGGTRPGGGGNLFHSFGEFGVPTNNIANFLNETALTTNNILGRVTGDNPSNIFGSIQTTGFGNANLFLMNPAGFLFGPTATIDVGGMMTFTSADYMKLADGARFNAIPNAATDVLLTASPVATFGFLGSNPGAITVQGSQFTLAEGTGISLVGGDIIVQSGTLADGTVQSAQLAAPEGQINITAVASAGEVSMTSQGLQPSQPADGGLAALGNISVSQGSNIDTSGTVAGPIFILGGRFVMDASSIHAIAKGDSGGASAPTGTPTPIAITADTVLLSNGTLITASTEGTAPAGDITFNVGTLEARPGTKGVPLNRFQMTGNLIVSDSRSLESNAGHAGTITIQGANGPGSAAKTISLDSSTLSTRVFGGTAELSPSAITLAADSVDLNNNNTASILGPSQGNPAATLVTTSLGPAPAGNIALHVNTLRINVNQDGTPVTSAIRANRVFLNSPSGSLDSTAGAPGTVTISGIGPESTDPAKLVALYNAQISTGIDGGSSGLPPGTITITTDTMTMSGRTQIFSSTLGPAPAGNIVLNVNQLRANVQPDGTPINGEPSSLLASASLAKNETAGRAGAVTISGLGPESTDSAKLISLNNTEVSTAVQGGTAATIPASITMTADALRLTNSPNIHTDTSGEAPAGHITFNVNNLTADHASQIRSSTTGSGNGGTITVTAGQSVTLNNGSSISAGSTGPGNAGNIDINAGQSFLATNSLVTTQANQSSGGAIKITTTPSGTVQITNSTISASVLDGTSGGGSVNIDPQVVILQNSQVLAQAVQGPGGNISITTNLLLQDANSVISASSGNPALNGTVTIQSPNSPASGKILPLRGTPLDATSLHNQRCAALADGEFSSFTVAGRDILPTEPGSWLASPLAAFGAGEALGVRGEGVTLGASLVDETTLLSLRQVAPAGFLTQAFGVDWSAGCQS